MKMMIWIALMGLGMAASGQQPTLNDAVARADTHPLPVTNIGIFHLARAPEQGILTLGHVPAGTQRLVIDG
ncbi:MAG: hypothetical protein KGJ05_08835, partial [Alphaproteobacteria bacterium]|nr:hypothetical protein [Alphaproteobacteria bacterium]